MDPMELDQTEMDQMKIFKEFSPWRIKKDLLLPNPIKDGILLSTEKIRVSVVDSPVTPPPQHRNRTLVGILIVPKGKEQDWSYSTDQGLQRLIIQYLNLSRLIVLKNDDESPYGVYTRYPVAEMELSLAQRKLKDGLASLFLEIDNPIFITHESEIRFSKVLINCSRGKDQLALVEDIEMDGVDGIGKEFRRRMRFFSTPNVLQADCKLVVTKNGKPFPYDLKTAKTLPNLDYTLNTNELLQPHLQAMIYGLNLVSFYLGVLSEQVEGLIEALSLGVGGGLLEKVLVQKFGMSVVGVEIDDDIFDAIKDYFKLSDVDGFKIILRHNAIDVVECMATGRSALGSNLPNLCAPYKPGKKFDIITLDIVVADDNPSTGLCAPPREFLEGNFFKHTKELLVDEGALIMHMIVPDFVYQKDMLGMLKKLFSKVYTINLGNDKEFIVVATSSSISSKRAMSGDAGGIGIRSKVKSLVPLDFPIIVEKGDRPLA